MTSTEELAASLAEAEGQLEAVEAGLSSDPTSQVSYQLPPEKNTFLFQNLIFVFSGPP